MEPNLHLITLGVTDLEASRRFYLDGLGWQASFEVPGAVTFIQVGHGLLLGLFGADALEADIGQHLTPTTGPSPFTLAQVVDSEEQVVAVIEAARAAGGTVLKPPQPADFGGFHGYFADPSGFRWEIATNSGWSVNAAGKVTIGPVEA
jgi:hypothetical protein